MSQRNTYLGSIEPELKSLGKDKILPPLKYTVPEEQVRLYRGS